VHFLRKNVQKDDFKEYSLKKVGDCGGLWGEMINFAANYKNIRSTHALFR